MEIFKITEWWVCFSLDGPAVSVLWFYYISNMNEWVSLWKEWHPLRYMYTFVVEIYYFYFFNFITFVQVTVTLRFCVSNSKRQTYSADINALYFSDEMSWGYLHCVHCYPLIVIQQVALFDTYLLLPLTYHWRCCSEKVIPKGFRSFINAFGTCFTQTENVCGNWQWWRQNHTKCWCFRRFHLG
jgi:hypothetical protein